MMKHSTLLLPMLSAAALLIGQTSHAQIPRHLNYQGRVSVQGVNFSGAGQFKFALVDAGTPFGDTATATAVVEGGAVTAVNVDQTGTNYAEPPAITFSGLGTGATATAELNLGIVITITVTNGGEGYTSPPTVTIAPPPTQTVYDSYWSNDGTSSVDPTVFHAKSFAWGGSVYVFGTPIFNIHNVGVAWRFDPAAQEWTQVPFQQGHDHLGRSQRSIRQRAFQRCALCPGV